MVTDWSQLIPVRILAILADEFEQESDDGETLVSSDGNRGDPGDRVAGIRPRLGSSARWQPR
ncbi:hypothetical protein [Agromyces sp. NPDC060279]|uniref:hypothetical protein n=1 Tax=Agromyces sp. NPDC060279 TaxID=3347092 RepID=UPI00365A5250